jgi:hypothetical protein
MACIRCRGFNPYSCSSCSIPDRTYPDEFILSFNFTQRANSGTFSGVRLGAAPVVAIDSTNGSVAILKHDGRRIEDISPNGQFVAWTEYLDNGDKNIVVQNVKTNTEQSFPVEKKFTQFGDAYFSPDSAKLAYAAAIGFPGKENGIAYIIDLKTKKVRTVATTSQSNSYYRIHGWRNDGQVDTVLESGDQTGFKMQ